MKKYIITAFGLLLANHVCAQDATMPESKNKHLNYDFGVKLYNELSFAESKTQIGVNPIPQNNLYRESQKTNILKPTIAVLWRNKKGNFHEVELNRFNIDVDKHEDVVYQNGIRIVVNGGRTVNTNLSVRYEHIVQFGKKKNSRLAPSLGFAVNPFYERLSYQPHISTAFPIMILETGFRTYITPRATYYFSRKFFMDVNVPLALAGFSIQYQKIQDPSLSGSQQKYGVMNFDMFRNMLNARVGLGLKL